jgi:MFS family permease
MTTFFSTLQASFTPLRIRNFRVYLGGQAVSLIGTWLQLTAQSWVVWELSKSPAALGTVSMLGTLPILFLSTWAGGWADRVDRRKLLIGTQVAAMILAFILAFLTGTKLVQLWHVYVLSLLLGVVTAIDMPTQQAFLGDLSGISEVRKAVNLNAMILQVSRMLGPALAGLVVGVLGASTAFWLNGISFIAVIASLVAVKTAFAKARQHHQNSTVQDAVRFVADQPRIQDLIIFVMLVTFFGLSVLNILPAVADKVMHGDATTLGWLMAASGAGALVGTALVVPYAQSLRRTGVVVGVTTMWIGAWYVLFSLTAWLPVALVCLFFSSLGAPVVITMALGLMQVLAPAHMRARLVSLLITVTFGMQPISSLLIGYSAEHLGTATAIQLNGILLIVGAAAMLAFRSQLRQWRLNLGPVETPAVDLA